MRLQDIADLLITLGVCTVLVLVIFGFQAPVLRVVLGLGQALFFTGYAIVAALYPRKGSLHIIERLVISFGLSIVVVPLIGMLLNYTPWGIRLEAVLLAVTSLIVLCSSVAYYRRRKLRPEERFSADLKLNLPRWEGVSSSDRLLSVILALSVVTAVGSLVYAIAAPGVGERFTEFYLLGSAGQAEEYPREAVAGEPIAVTIGVVNREHADIQYRVQRTGSAGKEEIATLHLRHGETWEQPYNFTLTEPGEDQKIEFLLYRGGEEEPYRSLHLWITVKEE